jgi:hypothetical protein
MHTPLQYMKAARALRDAAGIRWSRSPNSRQLFGVDITAGFSEERLALATAAAHFMPPADSLEVSPAMVRQLLRHLTLSKHPGFS